MDASGILRFQETDREARPNDSFALNLCVCVIDKIGTRDIYIRDIGFDFFRSCNYPCRNYQFTIFKKHFVFEKCTHV